MPVVSTTVEAERGKSLGPKSFTSARKHSNILSQKMKAGVKLGGSHL
jgi:hypothetical protein